MDPAINAIVRMETTKYSVGQVYGDLRSDVRDNICQRIVDTDSRDITEGSTEPSATGMVFGPHTLFSRKDATNSDDLPLVEPIHRQITEARLPDRVREAIEKKQEQEPPQQEYVFRIWGAKS